MADFNGLGMNLGNLSRLSDATTFSISPENRSGGKGCGAMDDPVGENHVARELGKGWKCHPFDRLQPGEVYVLADIKGCGAIQSMWFTGQLDRNTILRFYWDDQATPSVEVPLPDFFAVPWSTSSTLPDIPQPWLHGGIETPHVNSMPVAVNPRNAFNCFWEMPFRKRCYATLENRGAETVMLFYQISGTYTDVPDDAAYFHATFRRANPLPRGEVFTILDGVRGQGHYVGTVLGYGCANNGWWGEGEVKFYLDGDGEYPTICTTGTEDYFGGSYNWDINNCYKTYSTAFLGHHQLIRPDGLYQSQQRHGMYRWHIMDPIRFQSDIKVTIQALGWRSGRRLYPETPDICSTAFWYQTLPNLALKPLPEQIDLEIV